MKAEHRKELETNILADKVGKLISGAKVGPSRGILFYAVIAAIAALAIFLVYRWFVFTSTETGKSWVKLEDGSSQLIVDLANSKANDNPTKAARLQMAYESLWLHGVKLIGSHPKEALRSIQKAEEDYAKLAKECKGDPVFEPEALYGLAIIEETKALDNRENLVLALDKYKEVVKSNKDSAFAKLAKQRIEDFENEEKYRDIQRFYQDLSVHMRGGQARPALPPNIEELLRGMKKE